MKKRITQDNYIKANRKASREAEIENHGHPVCYKRVHQSKKVYNRKNRKAGDEALPLFLHDLRKFSGKGVDNKAMHIYIRWYQRMMQDGIHRTLH